jgi:hypothetical protein
LYTGGIDVLICTVPAQKRKAIQQRHVFVTAVIVNTTALLLRGDFDRPANAALFANMTTYIKTQATAFLTAAPSLAVVQPLLLAFLDLIPWSIILLVGAVVAWQSYSGYQSYEREDLSGMGKCILNILVLVALLFTSSAITDAMVAGGAGA